MTRLMKEQEEARAKKEAADEELNRLKRELESKNAQEKQAQEMFAKVTSRVRESGNNFMQEFQLMSQD